MVWVRGLVAGLFLVFLLGSAPTTHADRRPVAVIDLAATPDARTLVTGLNTALNNHTDLKTLDNPVLTAALQGQFVDEDAQNLAVARLKKQEAEDFLALTDDANAARSARTGMDALAYVRPDAQEMLGLYADLAFAFGRAQIGLRRPNDASHAFQLAHRLDPQRNPDPTQYEPNIVQAYAAAVKKPAIAAKLEVTGSGRVWIDGVELGPAGVAYDTTEGLHLVQVTGVDRETRGEEVGLPATTTTNIPDAKATDELLVKRARISFARARDPAERASAMKKLAALLAVEDAVLIVKDGVALKVQTWRSKEQGFTRLIEHRDENPVDLLKPLAPPSLKIEKKFEPDPPPIVIEKRWYQKTWVRASITTGVIAGIVSAILYARREKMLPPFEMDIKEGGR
jgi:hypothetical protein